MLTKFKFLPLVALGIYAMVISNEAHSWSPACDEAFNACAKYQDNKQFIPTDKLEDACKGFMDVNSKLKSDLQSKHQPYNACCRGWYTEAGAMPGDCKNRSADDVGRCANAAGACEADLQR